MKENILGKNELESIKLNWDVAVPGLMTTRCCATGTCENRPLPIPYVPCNYTIFHFSPDEKDAKTITMRYGYLRSQT